MRSSRPETFLAILVGTIGGGIAAAELTLPFSPPSFIVAAMMLAFSLACWLSALMIPPHHPGGAAAERSPATPGPRPWR